jgi:hypothetical protein
MLVYGDAVRTQDPCAMLARILDGVQRAAAMPAGIERHGALTAAFIKAGELVQGLADAEFAVAGHDAPSPVQSGAMALLMRLADALRRSWDSSFAAAPGGVAAPELAGLTMPEAIETRRPEGYAFYALYPESYIEAAKALQGRPSPTVIGIRSIGTGLAALVASVLGAEHPITLRPVGHPFRRALSLAPELADAIRARAAGTFAVVDEGPGLSGSSFGAVLDFLEAAGVAAERIHVFPSHLGELGPEASPRHRERWARLPRHCVAFDALALHTWTAAHRLDHWVEDLIGPLTARLADLSGGAWRSRVFASEAEWPAANVQQERLKFLARTERGTFLLKFAGLGEDARKLARARLMSEAGFTPPVVGHRHGFLIERWIADATPLDPARVDRACLVDTVGRYLALRARHFPAATHRGASLEKLVAMARHNTAQALGPGAAAALDAVVPSLPELEREVRPVEIDGRMHAWEWLVVLDGRLLKTDALDHHAAHDLVGCQDVAWDVVGAMVELGLTAAETADLHAVVERETGSALSPELLRLHELCYLAFQLGAQTLAAGALVGFPAEAERLKCRRDRYAAALKRALSPHC